MSRSSPHVLLVGQKLRPVCPILEKMEGRGCRWEFVETPEDGRQAIVRADFDVVLADSQLDSGGAYSLIPVLLGTRSSLFFWVPLERSGCLLPVVLRGNYQFRAVALRPEIFEELLSVLLWNRPMTSPAPCAVKARTTRISTRTHSIH
jgi:hypothetical protein